MCRFVIPPVWFILAALLMLLLDRLAPGPQLLSPAWGWLAMLSATCGFFAAIWAALFFRSAGTPIEPWHRPTALVTTGPFRVTRNPMYLGLALILLGFAVWLGSATPWLGIPMFVWAVSRNFIQREERWLEDRFGEDYRAYKARVRRWI
jgi:protein-S-isoprenylcysteine O-methyltransferase Ste14